VNTRTYHRAADVNGRKVFIGLHPTWQQAFGDHEPKTLIVWRKNDPFFIPHSSQVAAEIKSFFSA